MDVTALARILPAGALLEELALRPGADLVVRVQAAPANGGRGAISLAGVLLPVQLPAGLAAGQRLPVRVVSVKPDEVLLQLRPQPGAAAEAGTPGQVAHVAGSLALTGEGKLVQLANELQQPGFALPLPNGDALTLAVGPDEQGDEGADAREGGGEASFVLHSATLGPIEAHLRLADSGVSVEVRVDPGAQARFAAAAPELTAALERALGGPARVEVAARRSQGARPARPRVDESFDAYA